MGKSSFVFIARDISFAVDNLNDTIILISIKIEGNRLVTISKQRIIARINLYNEKSGSKISRFMRFKSKID